MSKYSLCVMRDDGMWCWDNDAKDFIQFSEQQITTLVPRHVPIKEAPDDVVSSLLAEFSSVNKLVRGIK